MARARRYDKNYSKTTSLATQVEGEGERGAYAGIRTHTAANAAMAR
jgi:hypothetical protein